jgi:hypothetical protein
MGPWDIDAGFFGSYTIGPYGGWDLPDLPTFHGGGTFRAPNAGGEGLAMLKDGETISRPGAGESGGNVYLTVNVAGNLTAQRDLERQLEASLKRAWQERN